MGTWKSRCEEDLLMISESGVQSRSELTEVAERQLRHSTSSDRDKEVR